MFSNIFNSFLANYHKKRGLRFIHHSKFKEAIHHFEKAFLFCEDLDNLFFFAVCLISLNRHEKAISYLERIFEESSENILISATLTECYLTTREWDKAEKMINKLLISHQENQLFQKYHTIVEDPILREKYALGKEHFYHATDELEKKQFDNAIDNIKKAIEYDSNNASYYFTASLILEKGKKQKQDIAEYLEKAILFAPQNETYKKKLHYIKTRYR